MNNKLMLEKKLHTQLNTYLFQYPEEEEKINKTINFLLSDKNCFTRENWHGHFTASAWIIDSTREWVLMTHHSQLDMWLQLGGHAEGKKDLLAVAIEEAKEESGIKNFTILSENIFDLDIHKIPKYHLAPEHFHFDVRFILETNIQEKIIVSDESHDVSWVKKNEVLNKNPEKSISRMMSKFLKNFSI